MKKFLAASLVSGALLSSAVAQFMNVNATGSVTVVNVNALGQTSSQTVNGTTGTIFARSNQGTPQTYKTARMEVTQPTSTSHRLTLRHDLVMLVGPGGSGSAVATRTATFSLSTPHLFRFDLGSTTMNPIAYLLNTDTNAGYFYRDYPSSAQSTGLLPAGNYQMHLTSSWMGTFTTGPTTTAWLEIIPAPVPEPASALLLAGAVPCLAWRRKKSKKA